MLMQRGSVTETTGWVLLSEGEYLKREVRPKPYNFTRWKLMIMGDHCCCDGACWSDTVRGFYIALVHPACRRDIPQVTFLLGLPDEDGAPHSEAVLPLKIKTTASADRMRLARFRPTAKMGCHLDEAWAAPVGTQQLGAKATQERNADKRNVWLLRRPHVAAGRERRG